LTTLSPHKAVHARLEGRVQGVGFRYSCLIECKKLGLTGWVRNTRDGGVEIWAEGPDNDLDAVLQWLRDGPTYARVTSLDYDVCQPSGSYSDFVIQR
jgi:acylphosphatase